MRDPGILYVVATPIGNLSDLSPRARQTLADAELIAAEDTRHTGRMLAQFGITTPLTSVHEHNELDKAPGLIDRIQAGATVALVCDAGTPLVSDPGYRLVADARAAGLTVSPIPGPCAAICALSAAGLPSDRFLFEGFLPPRRAARQTRLAELASEPATLIFYVPPRGLSDTLDDLRETLGGGRRCSLARELTKLHETFYWGDLDSLRAAAAEDADMTRGEAVLLVAGNRGGPVRSEDSAALERLLQVLMAELPLKQAVALASAYTGDRPNAVYRLALSLKNQ